MYDDDNPLWPLIQNIDLYPLGAQLINYSQIEVPVHSIIMTDTLPRGLVR